MAGNDLLNQLEIISPCSQDWDSMAGDGRSRFCSHCRKEVHDLEAMTASEVVELIRDNERGACARFSRRADGTVITADSSPREKRTPKRRAWQISLRMLIGVVTTFASGIGAARLVPREWLFPLAPSKPTPQPTTSFMGMIAPRIIIQEEEEDAIIGKSMTP